MDVSRSRSTTSESEEQAISNGKKTLEEVMTRLNDLDGEQTRENLEKGRALISVARFPFLSNLFDAQVENNSIVVDEDDFNMEDNPIADIFLWRFPLVSSLWFASLQCVFFLHIFCDYSLLTIWSFLCLWYLVVDFLLVQIIPRAQKLGIFSEDVSIKETLRKNIFFNAKLVKRVADVAHELADIAIGLWRVTVLEANMARIFIATRFILIFFMRSFSVTVTAYVILMAFFTIPVSYSKNRLLADVVADTAHENITRRSSYLRRLSRNMAQKVHERSRAASDELGIRPSGSRMFNALIWQIIMFFVERFNSLVEKLFD